jgi:hypothetical protein
VAAAAAGPTFIRTQASSDASRNQSLAEEQFLEQTPWANPQHPIHSRVPATSFHTQTSQPQLVTPAPQTRFVDAGALNGSVSTIEIMSNPPSSAPGPGSRAGDQMPASDAMDNTPLPLGRLSSNALHSRDPERIQTTHTSSSFNQHQIPGAAGQHLSPSAKQPTVGQQSVADPSYSAGSYTSTRLPSIYSVTTAKAPGPDIIGISPPRPPVAASVGGGARFRS